VDPANSLDDVLDLLIEDGKIARIQKGLRLEGSDVAVLDAAGMLVVPGLIDLHVHLREPGFEYKETIRTGTMSAAAGGVTTVCCMPNTRPVNDNQSVTEFILEKARKEGVVRVLPAGAITKGSKGEELAEIGELREAGCVAITDDGRPVMNGEIMRRALEYAGMFALPVMSHAEDEHLSAEGVMNEGKVATELGLQGIPSASEEVMVTRDIALAELTGGHLHVAHVSTAASVRWVRDGKKRGVRVTAETAPHYFTLTDDAVRGYRTEAKMNPPLRSDTDREAILEGLRDGTIDAIATDHAPHAPEEKDREFDQAPFGIVGLETLLPLTLRLVEAGVLPLPDAIALMTIRPARVLGIDSGTLSVGKRADMTLIRPGEVWTVDPAQFQSKSRNTPFAGWKMTGKVYATLVNGKVVYQDGVIQS
jgi:dihydroorotase